MAEKNIKTGKKPKKDEEKKVAGVEEKKIEKTEDLKRIENAENKKETEKKVEEKEEKSESRKIDKKKEDKKIDEVVKKTDATVNGRDLHTGKKHSVAICDFIRGKNIDTAISQLEEVLKLKRAIPMKGEIPHRKGMMSGRYPVKGTGIYLKLLKSLRANAISNDLELEKFKLFAMANRAARPYKRFGSGRFKRTHVVLKLIPIQKPKNEDKKKK